MNQIINLIWLLLLSQFFVCKQVNPNPLSQLFTMPYRDLLKYILPFNGITFFPDYLRLSQRLRSKGHPPIKLYFTIFLSLISLKVTHFLYLALWPLSPSVRLLHYDHLFFLFKDSFDINFNFSVAPLFTMILYFAYIFFTQPCLKNNQLLSGIVLQLNDSFFIYPYDCSGISLCLIIRTFFLRFYNLMQAFKLFVGKVVTDILINYLLKAILIYRNTCNSHHWVHDEAIYRLSPCRFPSPLPSMGSILSLYNLRLCFLWIPRLCLLVHHGNCP